MIVDLVRNDLARCSMPGSVKVEELFGIYEFPQVYHMISTVTSKLKPSRTAIDAIRSTFPMGSMTGAPKVMAMELIEKYEQSRRGVYSGAIGYFSPEGDFDLNVVIRTIQYNASRQYLSFQVGGAITYDSIPEKEYEECMVKIKGILRVLGVE
jgi:para-aminobenzoate synthetase component 1